MKNAHISIRAYREATDLQALSSIWFEASRCAHSFLGEALLREQRVLIETIYLPRAESWVAVRHDQPLGFISLLEGFIGGLFVSPHVQGQGIGRALIDHAMSLKGELELEVYLANRQACAFYKALGFVEISRRDHDDQGLPFGNARLRLKR